MPIFNGFDGERFQFDGSPNKFFNLLTDTNAQINVHFNSNKNIDAVGIRVGSTPISWQLNDERPTINNKRLYHRCYFNLQNNLGFAEMKFQFEPTSLQCIKCNKFLSCLFVNVINYHLHILKNVSGFDINISILDKNARPHGILGQTADFNGAPRITSGNYGEGIIQGNLFDYEVKDLWTNNFKYNRFKESA